MKNGDYLGISSAEPITVPQKTDRLASFGFRFAGTAHISKTMMLNDISHTIIRNPPGATLGQYRNAIIQENILSKTTQSNRQKMFDQLKLLYGLDGKIPVFSIYRELILFDIHSAPLLSLLISWARDAFLRASTSVVFQTAFSKRIRFESFHQEIQRQFQDQYSSASVQTISWNVASTWTQSGHLVGRMKKIRTRVKATPTSATMAFILGYISGYEGEDLLTSPYCKLLDLNPMDAHSLALQAHRANLINLKSAGSVIEISFNRYKQYLDGIR